MGDQCLKSECDLFAAAPVQTSILGDNIVTLKPVASLDHNTQMEFYYAGGAADMYLDPSRVYLRLKISISKSSTTPAVSGGAAATDVWETGFVNHILPSLFSSREVSLNETNISATSNDHHNVANAIRRNLYASKEAIDTQFRAQGSATDIMADGISDGLVGDKTNLGWKIRIAPFEGGHQVVLEGRLEGDIFDQPKLIPSGFDFRVKFVFAEPAFYFWHNKTTTSETKMTVHDASLFVRQVRVNPSAVIAHNRVLGQKHRALYPMKRSEIKTYTIPHGVTGFNLHNVQTGPLPDLMCVCFIEQDAFHGNIKKNPYHFKDLDLVSLSLYVNGMERKIEDFTFGTNGNWATAYSAFYQGLGVHHPNEGRLITYDMYGHNYTMFVFDLTPDGSGHHNHTSVKQIGNIRIHGSFGATTLTAAITCVVYSEFSAVMELDEFRKPVIL